MSAACTPARTFAFARTSAGVQFTTIGTDSSTATSSNTMKNVRSGSSASARSFASMDGSSSRTQRSPGAVDVDLPRRTLVRGDDRAVLPQHAAGRRRVGEPAERGQVLALDALQPGAELARHDQPVAGGRGVRGGDERHALELLEQLLVVGEAAGGEDHVVGLDLDVDAAVQHQDARARAAGRRRRGPAR